MKPLQKAIFPVAGLGTRFLPATKSIPKEMLTVVDRPLIQYAVDEAVEAGIRAMLTHPIDAQASAFYTRFGFIASPLSEQQLLLLLKEARHAWG
mgnify:CR=1 FL=1